MRNVPLAPGSVLDLPALMIGTRAEIVGSVHKTADAATADLEAAEDRESLRAEVEQKLAHAKSPLRAVERISNLVYLIDPRDTRKVVCGFADGAYATVIPGIHKHA